MIPYEIFFNRLETDIGATIDDDITTVSGRKTKNSDLEKARNGELNFFILVFESVYNER